MSLILLSLSVQKWISYSDCELDYDRSNCAHQSMSPALSTLAENAAFAAAFRAVLTFPRWRAPIILSVLALPFLGLTIPVPVFAFALTVSQLFQLLLPALHPLTASLPALLPF